MRTGTLLAMIFTFIIANEKTRKMFEKSMESASLILEKEIKNSKLYEGLTEKEDLLNE